MSSLFQKTLLGRHQEKLQVEEATKKPKKTNA